MLKRFGDNAPKESAMRADNLETEGDGDGAATWRRITDAVVQLANTTPTGRCTDRRRRRPGQLRSTSSHVISRPDMVARLRMRGFHPRALVSSVPLALMPVARETRQPSLVFEPRPTSGSATLGTGFRCP